MALITRLSRLFQADIHALLDKIEEPEALLKQAIRDMEESTALDEQQIRLWEYEQQQLIGKHDELTKFLYEQDEKLELCFKSGKNDLARCLLKRKLETQQNMKVLAGKKEVLIEQTKYLSKQLAEHQAKLADMRQKADILIQDSRMAVSPWDQPIHSISDEDVEVAFLFEKQKWGSS